LMFIMTVSHAPRPQESCLQIACVNSPEGWNTQQLPQ
jgi:hypothetical protein